VQRIAVVGTRDSAIGVAQRILRAEGSSSAVDIYDSRSEDPDPRFVGGPAALQSAMSVRPYDRVVVAIPLEDVEHMQATVRSLGAYTTELLLCTDLTALPIATASARRIPGIRTEVVHLLPASESSWLVKRALDVIIATVALMFLAPLFALVALAIRLDSNGPVFFRQRRLGQNNVVFSICKFRSMAVIEDGPVISQATRDDRRVTKVGRLLRKTSIDELPQLINVLMGDMSIVGPRPHAVAHDHAFERQLDLFSRRRRVKPGMTGWAQVNGFRGEISTPEHLKRRMEHDLYYIDRWSIWLDVEIMARTVLVVAKGKGAY
jgi:putative colanic acid biosynthesis UDP-glucose lipid carrier transferase